MILVKGSLRSVFKVGGRQTSLARTRDTFMRKSSSFLSVSEQVLELHRGQGMDIHWRDTYSCPSEEEYHEMVIRSETNPCPSLSSRYVMFFVCRDWGIVRSCRETDAIIQHKSKVLFRLIIFCCTVH
jgi:hypothetical protein